ncbi:MAG: hypothetical protein JO248_05750, partial [Acidimicrobiia bacterium]|nr:hypothetical protein [Acidimicrobiia bacterium]
MADSPRWLIAFAITVAAAFGACSQSDPPPSALSAPPAPATVVDAALSPTGEHDTIEVRSTATRAVLRSFGPGFLMAGDTIARSADGAAVAYLHYGGRGMAILATADGSSTDLPGGFDTALSSDGRYLAWWDASPTAGASDRQIGVLDRSSGIKHDVDVAALVGEIRSGVTGHGLVWLAGGHRLAIVADRQAPMTAGGPILGPFRAPPTTTPPPPMPRLIVINVDAPNPVADAVVLDGPADQRWRFVSAGTSSATAVVGDYPDSTTTTANGHLWTIDVRRAGHSRRLLTSMPPGILPLDLDRSNSYLLYFGGPNNELRYGTIRGGGM